MKALLNVIQHRSNKWNDKNNRAHDDHILVGTDADAGKGGEVLEVMIQGLVPDDQVRLFPIGSLIGKKVELGVSRIIMAGTQLKFVGRVLSVDGKPVTA